ncbi:MAG: ATP-dependent helicase [Prolixibacteraceae bacterium]|nr:ATP-dependent helicase [Prolixibacteraceae bacterium]
MGDSSVELSEKQKEIVNAKGNVVVNACPGSGKTFSVAARIAHLISSRTFYHQGIAAISFTNTAWQEIENKLRDDFNIDSPIRYPHFLGTIDSFLNKYVFLPYGHLRLKTNKRPQLVGEPHSSWSGRGYYDSFFDKVSFDKEGVQYIFNGTIIRKDLQEEIFKTKMRIMKGGLANQADANYIAMRVLQKYPLIARNISMRFPFIIVDEAQDTTDVQMEIINILNQFTKEIMLIGDPDQAIFEWNNAKPELFDKKIEQWFPPIQLDENRRSSSWICNCANAFIEVEKSIPFKNSDVKDYNFIPKVIEYKLGNQLRIDLIKSYFLRLCKNCGIEDKNIAIIYRSNSFGKHLGKPLITKDEQPWIIGKYYVRDIVHGKYLYENGDFKKGLKYIEHGFHKAITGNSYLESDFIKRQIEEKGFVKYRQEMFDFIDLLPACNGEQLDVWIKKATKTINDKYSFDFPINRTLGRKTIDSFFATEDVSKDESQYHTGTIHSVKGETYDAILMFIKDAAGNNRKYRNLLERCQNDEDREEKRIIYVGLTRARKILVLAVPEGCKDIWSEKLKLK